MPPTTALFIKRRAFEKTRNYALSRLARQTGPPGGEVRSAPAKLLKMNVHRVMARQSQQNVSNRHPQRLRWMLALAACFAALIGFSEQSAAQTFPAKPV